MNLLLVCYRSLLAPSLLLFATMPSCCRFLPSCSEYAQEAVRRHGWKGFFLAVKRLLRCRPLLFKTPDEQGIRLDPVSPCMNMNMDMGKGMNQGMNKDKPIPANEQA